MSNVKIPRPEHPNPMMFRKDWQNLNGQWLFSVDFGASGTERGMMKPEASADYDREITVPFCVESELSGIGIKDFMPSVWYKREVEIAKEKLDGRVLLHIGAADYETRVYVNGTEAGYHFGGYSSFSFDITEQLVAGKNDITINVKDDIRSETQPGGKQSRPYYSKGCYYTRTTGIWQTVWLEFVPNAYIKAAKYYPDINNGAFNIELATTARGTATVEAFFEGRAVGSVSSELNGNGGMLHLPLTEKHLWEVGNGNLYDLRLTLKTDDGVDTVESYAGLREVAVDGFKVLINGKSVFQRTVLDQGFYPDGIYTAPTAEALKHDIELSMDLGFNGARLHEKIFEPLFLYYCDKAGYLVWGESANWNLDTKKDIGMLSFLPEWIEAVERDFNHPSIIGWCPFNETWEANNHMTSRRTFKAVYDITKSLDTTRPVIDTSGGFHEITDIFDQHDYDQNAGVLVDHYKNYDGTRDSFFMAFADKQRFIPHKPLFISEYGGIGWIREQDRDSVAGNAWGYGEGPKTEEEFFERYEALTNALKDNPNIMGFCYTQLYDVEQEINGLYTYGREKKFADYSRVRAANLKKAAIED